MSARACFALVFALAVTPAPLRVSAAEREPEVGTRQVEVGKWNFSLLPKSFQRTPRLDVTVMTDVTAFGRTLPVATAESPVYYVAHDTGFKVLGEAMGEKPPPHEEVVRAMMKALAVNHYRPITDAQQLPQLAVIYHWGTHDRMDREMEMMFPQRAAQQRLERAALIGGQNFLSSMRRVTEWGETFADRVGDFEFLHYQAADDLYFVVASAYDYRALAAGQRKLAWRTKMTVNGHGVSPRETITPLIAVGAPFLGREMTAPHIARPQIARWGVTIGPAIVVEEDVSVPSSANAPGKPK